MADVIKARVMANKKIALDIYSLELYAPAMAKNAKAGQFVHIDCGEEFLLRRPISICDRTNDSVRVIFEVKGAGTTALSKVKNETSISVIGPVGKGFPEFEGKILAVGGGIGVPPMLMLSKEARCGADAVLGFRSKDKLILHDEFTETCKHVVVTTDDGSFGEKGTVLPVVEQLLKMERYAAVCACGPKVMLKSIAKLCSELNVVCYVSLEERMGCGVGACLTCSCKVKKTGEEHYARVCKDGPVFDSAEVCWDE